MTGDKTKYMSRAGIIAAIYVILTLVLGEQSFGPIQVRISEALVLMPIIDEAAIPGVFIGCMFSNIFGGYGLVDIVFGSITTLCAAFLTSRMPNRILGVLPPVILNAFIVSIWVSKIAIGESAKIFGLSPYWSTVITIGLGELVSVGVLGMLLLTVLQRTKYYK